VTRGDAIIAVVLLLAAAGCGGNGDAGSASTGDGPYGGLYQGLCRARAEASQPDTARATFFDRVHQPLHELAAEAAGHDRAAAARLLEAKQAVEGGFAGDPGLLGAELDRLVEATREAIAASGRRTPDACKEGP
jgi:hypothetical protein